MLTAKHRIKSGIACPAYYKKKTVATLIENSNAAVSISYPTTRTRARSLLCPVLTHDSFFCLQPNFISESYKCSIDHMLARALYFPFISIEINVIDLETGPRNVFVLLNVDY